MNNNCKCGGKVTLLGAGPGDLELLTIKAAKALAAADVLLLDDLVNPDIVALAPQARVVRVGKRGGCKSTPQDFIQRLMRRYAMQGLHVVRAKGGEALMFGRAGEEMAYLNQFGIEINLVNGISAGMAASASLGMSLTLRGQAQSVIFVTAHMHDEGEPDWQALAATRATLVIYMGMSRLGRIVKGLSAGLPPDTPAAVVEAASTPAERRILTTLAALEHDARQAQMKSPAIILVGCAAAAALACGNVGSTSAEITLAA
jgi:uroporphyrin-III C-methyltransferase